jgi:histone-lysine N-methyltransferase SETMAR
MTGARDFVAGLARASKGYEEIKKNVDAAFGDKTLQKMAIYAIIKKVKAGENTSDQRHLNGKKTVRNAALIASVAAAVEQDRRLSVKSFAVAHGVGMGTIHRILHEDLGLEKKSARWVPKLLSQDQKIQRVEDCRDLVAAVHRHSFTMLDNIVTMGETMVSYHTPETKKQSKQWIAKGKPGPIKARVQAGRTKQMILAFFDNKGLVYSHIVTRGVPINADYIVKVLGLFMKQLKKKRPATVAQQWWFHWDNAPVHTAAVVQEWLAAHGVQVIRHPPYSPDLALADFFLFRRVKEKLTGLTLDQNTIKKTWAGVTRSIAPEEFAIAFRRWYERCEKCVEIGGDYVEKS